MSEADDRFCDICGFPWGDPRGCGNKNMISYQVDDNAGIFAAGQKEIVEQANTNLPLSGPVAKLFKAFPDLSSIELTFSNQNWKFERE